MEGERGPLVGGLGGGGSSGSARRLVWRRVGSAASQAEREAKVRGGEGTRATSRPTAPRASARGQRLPAQKPYPAGTLARTCGRSPGETPSLRPPHPLPAQAASATSCFRHPPPHTCCRQPPRCVSSAHPVTSPHQPPRAALRGAPRAHLPPLSQGSCL